MLLGLRGCESLINIRNNDNTKTDSIELVNDVNAVLPVEVDDAGGGPEILFNRKFRLFSNLTSNLFSFSVNCCF